MACFQGIYSAKVDERALKAHIDRVTGAHEWLHERFAAHSDPVETEAPATASTVAAGLRSDLHYP
jgi:hypothetical protein